MQSPGSFTDDLIERLMPRGTRRRDAARVIKRSAKGIFKRVRKDHSVHIFIACFQKSGSSYLTALLSEITGFTSRAIVEAYGHNEQDVSRIGLEQMSYTNSVSQQHARGTDNNVALLKEFDVRPVVLVRNIYDVVVSLYDHVERGRHRVPTGYVHREYAAMNEDEKLLYLIRIHLPWYFNFLISWREACTEIDAFWLTYEQLFSDQVQWVSQILSFYDLPVHGERIHAAIEELTARRKSIENVRFNVGVAGRGQRLSAQHKQAILDIAGAWKVDDRIFDSIGIEPSTGLAASRP